MTVAIAAITGSGFTAGPAGDSRREPSAGHGDDRSGVAAFYPRSIPHFSQSRESALATVRQPGAGA